MKPFADLSTPGQISRIRRALPRILSEYGLDTCESRPLRHWENTVFKITCGTKKYALRVRRPTGENDPDIVRSELEWLTDLSATTELAVPRPVPARNGDPLVLLDCDGIPGPRCCALFEWVDGRFRHPDALTLATVAEVGAFMARLHCHALGFKPPSGFSRPLQGYADPRSKTMNDGIDRATQFCSGEDAMFLHTVRERLHAALERVGYDSLNFNLIHADLHPWNYLFQRGEVRAIDFDDCGWGHFMYDIAVSVRELEYREDYQILVEAFFEGYRSVRYLSAKDEDLLPLFVAARRLWLMAWTATRVDHPEMRMETPNAVGYTVERLRDDGQLHGLA